LTSSTRLTSHGAAVLGILATSLLAQEKVFEVFELRCETQLLGCHALFDFC
jgi:hypothetical protein